MSANACKFVSTDETISKCIFRVHFHSIVPQMSLPPQMDLSLHNFLRGISTIKKLAMMCIIIYYCPRQQVLPHTEKLRHMPCHANQRSSTPPFRRKRGVLQHSSHLILFMYRCIGCMARLLEQYNPIKSSIFFVASVDLI